MNKFSLINIFVRTEDELPSERSGYYPPSGVNTTLRAEWRLPSERSEHYPPSGVNITLRTECILPSERSEHYTPNGVYITPRARQYLCPERDSTPAPSEVRQYTLCSAEDVKSEFSFCKNKQHLYRRLLILLDCSGL